MRFLRPGCGGASFFSVGAAITLWRESGLLDLKLQQGGRLTESRLRSGRGGSQAVGFEVAPPSVAIPEAHTEPTLL